MAVNIEKMRFDIAQTQRQIEANQRQSVIAQKWETRKFVVSVIVAAAALAGGGAAIGNYLARTAPSPFPPGTVITVPPAPAK